MRYLNAIIALNTAFLCLCFSMICNGSHEHLDEEMKQDAFYCSNASRGYRLINPKNACFDASSLSLTEIDYNNMYDFTSKQVCTKWLFAKLSAATTLPCELIIRVSRRDVPSKSVKEMLRIISSLKRVQNVQSIVIEFMVTQNSNYLTMWKDFLLAIPNLKKLDIFYSKTIFFPKFWVLTIFNFAIHLENAVMRFDLEDLRTFDGYVNYLKYFSSRHLTLKVLDFIKVQMICPQEFLALYGAMPIDKCLLYLDLRYCSFDDVMAIMSADVKFALKSLSIRFIISPYAENNTTLFLFEFASKLEFVEEMKIEFEVDSDSDDSVFSGNMATIILSSLPNPQNLVNLSLNISRVSSLFTVEIDSFCNLSKLELINITIKPPAKPLLHLKSLYLKWSTLDESIFESFPNIVEFKFFHHGIQTFDWFLFAFKLLFCSRIQTMEFSFNQDAFASFMGHLSKLDPNKIHYKGILTFQVSIYINDFKELWIKTPFFDTFVSGLNTLKNVSVRTEFDNLSVCSNAFEEFMKSCPQNKFIRVHALRLDGELAFKKNNNGITWDYHSDDGIAKFCYYDFEFYSNDRILTQSGLEKEKFELNTIIYYE